MKKLFLLLIAAISCNLCALAQDNLVATLQHGSNIQAFYGEDALSTAHEAAADGDVITLSAGEFNGLDMTKVITLRGEGTERTHIKNHVTFTIPENSHHTLLLEGLNISTSSYQTVNIYGFSGSEKVVVSKCYFDVPGTNTPLAFEKCNASVMQSHVVGAICANNGSHVTCLNSVFSFPLCKGNGKFDIANCYMNAGEGDFQNVHYSTIKNSIIHTRNPWLDITNSFSHCLTQGNIPVPVSDFGWVLSADGDVWNGIVEDNYHLSEEAAATYIGTDGTQIGIYGGMYPYDLTPSYPLVKALDVIGSHKNGKLIVKINVK